MTIIRDEKGRFQKGVSGNPSGRAKLADELPTIEGMKAACTAERVAEILDKMYTLAIKGNTKAAALYLAYAIGKPVQQDLEARIAELERRLGIEHQDSNRAA